MSKKIGVIDLDKIRKLNLPIAKLFTYARNKKYSIEWYHEKRKYDIVFATCVFTWNAYKILKIFEDNKDSKIVYGGTGFYPRKIYLPNIIEHQMPFYEAFANANFSYGWTTRGCNRRCNFCLVNEYFGNTHITSDIYEFYHVNFHDIRLLDDNILFKREHAIQVLQDIIKNCLRLDMSQGFDIRLLDERIAKLISKIIFKKYIRFAWDYTEDEKSVMRGISLLSKYKINIERLFFYCICRREPLTKLLRDWNNHFKFRCYLTFQNFLQKFKQIKLLKNASNNFKDIYYRLETLKSKGIVIRVMLYGGHTQEKDTGISNILPIKKKAPLKPIFSPVIDRIQPSADPDILL